MLDVHSTRADRGRKTVPFGQLPHDLASDPRLGPTAVRVAAALLFWARAKPECWPSDASIAARVGRCAGTVQRALRRLEAAGWIARRRTAANRTGRLIVLAWRGAGARPAPAPAPGPPAAPARDEGDRIVKAEAGKETPGPTPPRPRPEPARPAGPPRPEAIPGARPAWSVGRDRLAAFLASDDPILRREAERRLAPRPAEPPPPASVPELLARVRESPAFVARAAEALAVGLGDRRSWNALHAACRRAWEGSLAPGALVAAWREATGGRARNPGAVFMAVLKRETPR